MPVNFSPYIHRTDADVPLCSICQIPQKEGIILVAHKIGKIFHTFHEDCLSSWFKRNQICPICRKRVVFEKWDRNHLIHLIKGVALSTFGMVAGVLISEIAGFEFFTSREFQVLNACETINILHHAFKRGERPFAVLERSFAITMGMKLPHSSMIAATLSASIALVYLVAKDTYNELKNCGF